MKEKKAKRVIAAVLALSMVLSNAGIYAWADTAAEKMTAGSMEQTADVNTTGTYGTNFPGPADDGAGRYTGRVWTDKSVFTKDEANRGIDLGSGAENYAPDDLKEDEFLEVFSALGSSESVSAKEPRPLDVVLVLDMSGSMGTDSAGAHSSNFNQKDGDAIGTTRIKQTVDAMNAAIKAIMEKNPNNRVGIAVYGEKGAKLLDLVRFSRDSATGRYPDTYLSIKPHTSGSEDGVYLHYYNTTDAQYILQIDGSAEQLTERPGVSGDTIGTWTDAPDISRTVSNYKSAANGEQEAVFYMTNIQAGIAAGMQILLDNRFTDWQPKLGDGPEKRKPMLILMTDGIANTITKTAGYSGSMTDTEKGKAWYKPDIRNPLNANYPEAIIQTLMTASYMRMAVDGKYGNDEEDKPLFSVKTILAGSLSGEMKDVSNAILQPENFFNGQSTAAHVPAAWNLWNRWKTASGAVSTGSSCLSPLDGDPYGVDPAAFKAKELRYTDGYLNPAFEDLAQTFKDLISDADSVGEAFYPFEDAADGKLEYIDPIGTDMEIRNFRNLILNGRSYNIIPSKGSEGRYTVDYTDPVMNNPFGAVYVNEIEIFTDGQNNLHITIPQNVIPVRTDAVSIEYDGDGGRSVTGIETASPDPLRITYTVGLKEDLKTAEGLIDWSRIDAEPDAHDVVYFYTNGYENGSAVGSAYTHFTPTVKNRYYIFQEDTPVYSDSECGRQATAAEVADAEDDVVYYYRAEYYGSGDKDGAACEIIPYTAEVAASELKPYLEDRGRNEPAVIPQGARRIDRLSRFALSKEDAAGADDGYRGNPTGTVVSSCVPAYTDGQVRSYLGNNGRLAAVRDARLLVTKKVSADESLSAENLAEKEFTFRVTVDAGASKSAVPETITAYRRVWDETAGNWVGVIRDGADAPAGYEYKELEVKDGVITFRLKHNEGLWLTGLPYGAKAEVKEDLGGDGAVPGFTVENTDVSADMGGAAGTGRAGTAEGTLGLNNEVHFTNVYKAGSLTVRKELKGSEGVSVEPDANEEFRFRVAFEPHPKDGEYDAEFSRCGTAGEPDGKYTAGGGKITITDGAAVFALAGGEEIRISGLPVGTEYTVEETTQGGYTAAYSPAGGRGIISDHSAAKVVVTNTKKKPQPAEVSLTAHKKLENTDGTAAARRLEPNEFTFVITPDPDNPAGDPLGGRPREVHNDADGVINVFSRERYTEAGSYAYTLAEKKDALSDVDEFDETVYTVTVDVFEDRTVDGVYNGRLTGAVMIDGVPAGEYGAGGSMEFVFTNRYNPDAVYLTLEGMKIAVMEAGDREVPYDGSIEGRFEFELSVATGSNAKAADREEPSAPESSDGWADRMREIPVASGANGMAVTEDQPEDVPLPDDGRMIVSNDAAGHFAFGRITYTKAGTYKYFIREVTDGAMDGWNYDRTVWLVTVTVREGKDGGLYPAGEPVYEVYGAGAAGNAAGITFTNVYAPDEPELLIKKEQTLTKKGTAVEGARQTPIRGAEDGDIVTYYITVTNPSNTAVKGAVITDAIPGPEPGGSGAKLILAEGSVTDNGEVREGMITWTLDIPAHSYKEVSFKVEVPDVAEDTLWKNVAAVTYASDPDGPEKIEETPPVEVESRAPHITIVKTQSVNGGLPKGRDDGAQPVDNGDVVTYYLAVMNDGGETAKDVWVTDTVPDKPVPEGQKPLTLARDGDHYAVSEGGTSDDGRTIFWNIGELRPGESREVWFRVNVPDVSADTVWENIGYVKYSNNPDKPQDPDAGRPSAPDPGNEDDPWDPSNEVEVKEGTAALTREKFHSVDGGELTKEPGTVTAGQEITYSILVTNEGPSDAANVCVYDRIPDGDPPLKLAKNADGTNKISDGGELQADGRSIMWQIENIEAGRSAAVSFTVTVPDTAADAEWENVAYVYHQPDGPDPETPPDDPDDPSGPWEPTNKVEDRETPPDEEYPGEPSPGRTPDPDPTPTPPPAPRLETITDEPTPLAGFENIEDEEVPLAFLAPVTGDSKPAGAAALFGLLALGMMGIFGILSLRKGEEDID